MRPCFRSLAFALACFTLFALAMHAEDPKQIKPTGYVIDLAGVLSPASRDQLTALCTELDQKAHAQIAVVTVHSLNGLPIEEFSIDVATQLGVGPKSDRGVLILFATDDRRYRVEVGYGLEGILPDGKVGGFGREAVPFLKAGDYNSGIVLITRRIADTIAADKGVALAGAQSPPPAPATEGNGLSGIAPAIIFVVFLLFFLGAIVNRLRGGPRGGPYRGSGWGGIASAVGWGLLSGGFRGGGGFGGGGGGFGGGGGGFGGFGGGGFGGGGASGSW